MMVFYISRSPYGLLILAYSELGKTSGRYDFILWNTTHLLYLYSVKKAIVSVFVYFCLVWHNESGGGTPLYTPYRYVPPTRVGFLRFFDLKTGTDTETAWAEPQRTNSKCPLIKRLSYRQTPSTYRRPSLKVVATFLVLFKHFRNILEICLCPVNKPTTRQTSHAMIS